MRMLTSFVTAAALLPLVACTASNDVGHVDQAVSTDIGLVDINESYAVDGLSMADGTRVATVKFFEDFSLQDPTGFDRSTANEYQPETVPQISGGLRVEGYDDFGGLLFSSDRALYALDAPVPLEAVRWQVRDVSGLISLDPADLVDQGVIAQYASVIEQVYEARPLDDTSDQPPAPTDTSISTTTSTTMQSGDTTLDTTSGGLIPRLVTPSLLAEGVHHCFSGTGTVAMAGPVWNVECFARLLDLLASFKDTYDKIKKAWDECGKANNEVNCASAAYEAAVAVARLGLRGWDFYTKCWTSADDKPQIIIPEKKLILPGDKDFKLPPGPIRQDK